jgi:prepilin-type processing-associated H-X9-DG protein
VANPTKLNEWLGCLGYDMLLLQSKERPVPLQEWVDMAMADGHVADSNEYFATVENLLQVSTGEAMSEAAQPTGRRSTATPPPAAPVSRDTRGGNIVRLTSEEREMAEMMKMTPEEYAKNKVALKKEGRMH